MQILCLNAVMKNIIRIFLYVLLFLPALSCVPKDRYVTITGYAQGGTYTVKLNLNGHDGPVSAEPEEIRDSIDSILSRIDKSLSGYNRNSLLSRFNAGEPVSPDSLFTEIYSHAWTVYDQTAGVVDVASAPLFDIWGFGFKTGEMPSYEAVMEVKAGCGLRRMKRNMPDQVSDGLLDPASMLSEDGPLPQLNFNAIAQGYSCDIVARYLYSIGVKDMMVDIGEIFCDGCNPSGRQWTLGIDRPVDGNNDPGAQMQGIFRAPAGPHGIVTSGNYRKFYVRDGRKYSHSIDPRTGYPVDHQLLSATIVAADAMTADAYATYCMVIGLDASKEFLMSRPDLEGCLIYDEDGVFRTWCSDGFVLEEI